MRRLFLIFSLLMPSLALAGTCGNGYSFTRQIKLHKAVNSDQTNFPFPLVGTYLPLATVANGGQVQNTANNPIGRTGQPADLVFCDAASAGNPLKYEIAYYSATTGTFEIWVQIPTLHTASNDSIYMFANNSGVVTTQQDLSFWAAVNYAAVYHLPNGSTFDVLDSVGSHNGTNNGATATAGKIDGAGNFVAASSQYVNLGAININTNVTLEAWQNTTGGGTLPRIVANFNAGGTTGYELFLDDNGAGTYRYPEIIVAGTGGVSAARCTAVSLDVSLNRWHHWVGTVTTPATSGSTMKLYVDGAACTTSTLVTNATNIGNGINAAIGQRGAGGGQSLDGKADEVRIATDVKSADWTATNYVTQAGLESAYQIVESSYSAPTITQFTSFSTPDSAGGTPGSRALPFPVTSTGYIAYLQSSTNFDCTNVPSDGLGLTLTSQITAHATGSLQNYYSCQYTAPITSTGADTVTAGSVNSGLVVMELKGVTTSGIATNADGSLSPPSMTATCGGSTCLLLCAENLTNSSSFTFDTYGNSQGYTEVAGPLGLPITNDHVAQAYGASAVVASGSRSCTLTGTGQAGTLMLLPASSSPAVRHRIVNQF